MTLTFKTNINCSNCVAKVTPFLDAETSISKWEVDTVNPEKILTIKGDGITSEKIIQIVKQAGYKIEPTSSGNIFTNLFKKSCCQ